MYDAAPVRLGLIGFSGLMGQSVLQALAEQPADIRLGGLLLHRTPAPAAYASYGHRDVRALIGAVDVVLDFSAPSICAAVAPECAALGRPYLVASTGLSAADLHALTEAANKVAILQAASLSLGVNVLLELVEIAADRLKNMDIEVAEVHHRHKRDAPSGTALALGEAAARGRSASGLPLTQVLSRCGKQKVRGAQEIGYAALRGGDVAGEHTVYFLGDGERLELSHRSSRREIFAVGALAACHWLVGRASGQYTMRDVVRQP